MNNLKMMWKKPELDDSVTRLCSTGLEILDTFQICSIYHYCRNKQLTAISPHLPSKSDRTNTRKGLIFSMDDGKICPFHEPRRVDIITIYCKLITIQLNFRWISC
jgi:hypothetical protein